MTTKFTPEVQKTILETLRENPSIYSAAAKADVTYQTVMRWLQKAETGAPEYVAFAQEVELARSQMKNEIVQSLRKIATDEMNPQAVRAARELLTALYPREFSSVKHVVQHSAKKEDDIDVTGIPSDELRAFLKTLKKIRGQEPVKKPAALVDVIEATANGKG